MKLQAPLPPAQLMALQGQHQQLVKERKKLDDDCNEKNRLIAERQKLIAELERTVAELQKPDGQREGLIRSEAEWNARKAAAAKAAAAATQPLAIDDKGGAKGPSVAELDLSARLARAMAATAPGSENFGFEDDDFWRHFGDETRNPPSLKGLSPEDRLLWEIRHPVGLDQDLQQDLIRSGRQEEAQLLESATRRPSVQEEQYRPLFWLRRHSNLDVNYVEQSEGGSSLLAAACQANYMELARELLDRGADASSAGGDAALPLLLACKGLGSRRGAASREPVVRLLLERRARLDVADPGGRTALMWAAVAGDEQVCRVLLAARADPTVRDDSGTASPELASASGHTALAQLLACDQAM